MSGDHSLYLQSSIANLLYTERGYVDDTQITRTMWMTIPTQWQNQPLSCKHLFGYSVVF